MMFESMKQENEPQEEKEEWVDVEAKKKAYFEQLKKGNPAKVEEGKKKLYEGGITGSEKTGAEGKGDFDFGAFSKANSQWLHDPRPETKPKLEDFPKKK